MSVRVTLCLLFRGDFASYTDLGIKMLAVSDSQMGSKNYDDFDIFLHLFLTLLAK